MLPLRERAGVRGFSPSQLTSKNNFVWVPRCRVWRRSTRLHAPIILSFKHSPAAPFPIVSQLQWALADSLF
jgi:hypothetical protein